MLVIAFFQYCHNIFFKIILFEFFKSILQDKLYKINKVMKEIYQLSNTNDINIKYKIQSLIVRKFIIVMDYYNRKHFIQHFLQVTRYLIFNIFKAMCRIF